MLRRGPVFDPAITSLSRHLAFHLGDELVLLFEGEHAERAAEALLGAPEAMLRETALAPHLAGPARFPAEVYNWQRPVLAEGLSYGPLPGPGYSEGGPAS